MSMTLLLCNVIPALIIIYFVWDGWRKGALFMFLSLIRLFVTYYIARWLGAFITNSLLSVPYINTRFSMIAQNSMDTLSQLPIISFLLTGEMAQKTVETITWWLLFGLCYFVLFIALMIFFSMVLRMSRMLNNVVIIGWFNRFIGACEGLIFSLIFTLILVYLAAYLADVFGYPSVSGALSTSWLPHLFTAIINSM